ncbi:efflux RND transporter permease subunit [Cytophaga hutchinsonii]|uniref:Cation efflux protein n=1 Tax=Cytophaga hutchinsonii (strain ATCC 33406 / DSM 1761 / CIP 103989 / NBRC 15051 / NCIMB 9469 / D465) TaxID=269798 RepID=A0A6N4SUB1_CYTH3|nr:efflux RND transporter permease subunit [Cytophaga hutchinsonii]ABG60057.1 cation efflux protein [Cytophaga hutchinsonii ATCC 33406]SFX24930.1 hydrophobic/amphiphilic exporter-1, HAE1 family [Cytophaga hutchinsonii ATCC 33406]
MSITEISIKRPLLITVIFFTLILFGWISYKSLNYNLLPKFEVNVITVQTIYRGASSDEIQSSITKPVEDAVASIEGIDVITSTSMEGVSMIVLQLKPGTSTINAQRDAERKINEIKATLPDDVDDPVIRRVNLDEIPVLKISATANMTQGQLYDLIDQKVKPLMLNVEGVGTVSIIGGNEREIKITLDNDKLQAYGISSALVNQIIANSNSSYPAGSVETTDDRLSIRMNAKVTTVDELRNLVITENKDGSRVLVKDVATVTDGLAESTTINRINGQSGIGIEIIKQSDANTVNVSQNAKKRLEELKVLYAAQGFNYQIASDQSVYTLASADAVIHDLFLAVLIVGSVMLLFLHSFRSSLFVLVAIPSAMIPTFILMYVFGFSLNLMTLMGLSLVVGILVDDSIVVLENIFRHLEMGKNKVQASLDGRSEIGFTAIAITLVDVVVFLPLSLSTGIIGNILREFSLVVVFSTLMSLFVSFTLTPLLASRWAKLEVLSKDSLWGLINIKFEEFLTSLKEAYGRGLSWVLKRGHKRWVLISIFLLFVGVGGLLAGGFIGAAFISAGDRGEFAIKVELAPETPLYQTNLKVKQIEEILLSQPEVTKVFTNVGTQSGAMGGGSSNSNLAEITVTLVDKSERALSADKFGVEMRNKIGEIPGIKVTVLPVSITGNSQSPIQIAVKGTDMDSLWKAARMLKEIVVATPGTDYVDFSTKSLKTEIDIKLNRDKLSNIGMSIPEVGNAIQLAFRGNDQTKFKDKGEEYSINVSLDKDDKRDIESVKNLIIRNSQGASIRLGDVAEVSEILGQSVLERTNRMNSIKVTSAAVGRPSGTIVADIQAALEKQKLPEGILIDYQGDAKNQKDAFGSLGMAMLMGIILVYLIMVALYESIVYPFVVLFSIPVAMIGAFLALALSMETMSIFAIVGLIMLLGLVAKNGILIVDFTNHLKAEGMSRFDALVEAGKERLRPILMTTIAMITGMLPIALATSSGAEVKNGMAWVIIGGLTSSLILTLFLVPTMYMIIDTAIERVEKFFRKRFFKKSRKELLAKETIDY